MRKVFLHGDLGETFGKEFNMHVKNVQQALKLLSANFKGFKQHLIDSKGVVGYRVLDGDYELEGKEPEFVKQGTGDIHIVPVVEGAGATGRIIAGVVLVVVGAVYGYYTGEWGTAGRIMLAGAALIAGGLAEKLAAKPKNADVTQPDNTQSYIFNGAINTTRQGVPVQIGYGKMLVGSAVISASITTVDIPV